MCLGRRCRRLTEDELYIRFLAGYTASYDELMIRLGDRLIVYINAYLHDWHDSEDLMIEAFARIMVRRPAIRSGGFTAYLYRTARNLAARSHANALRTKHFSLDSVSDELSDGKKPRRTCHRYGTQASAPPLSRTHRQTARRSALADIF